ncbi:hypothetical protein [Streptomyces lydicus]|uniref:hypothetical protein n=1 Tax=Streptomyces lydicus TaxID=47763 RepID=UPI00286FE8CD|nr:hypothetical protein [Streptomyces lydicus]
MLGVEQVAHPGAVLRLQRRRLRGGLGDEAPRGDLRVGDTGQGDVEERVHFNRLTDVNEQLVRGRAHLYFGHQFATKAAKALPDHAVQHYVDTLAADPATLRCSFAFYRALDTTIAQNQRRAGRPLTLPV